MLKVFWVLTPPPPKKGDKTPKNASHWGNVKNVKKAKGLLTKKYVKHSKKVKSFLGLDSPPPPKKKGGAKTKTAFNFLTFLTFPQF